MDPLLESRVRLNLDAHEERLAEMREAWRAYHGAGWYGGNGRAYPLWDLPVEDLVGALKGEAPSEELRGRAALAGACIELNLARLIVNKGGRVPVGGGGGVGDGGGSVGRVGGAGVGD